ncbi:Protocadherin-16 [Branchiostoma belcheri]|nr:Protocadherin-16 [Branchiostoma belcheri]
MWIGKCLGKLEIVSASDPDEGVNGDVTYSFPPTPIARQLPFTIQPATGWICTTETLDHDTEPSRYDFSVTAKDGGNLDATAWVSIFVQDVNDNRPEFYPLSYPADVQENSPVGLEVVSVTASDRDSGRFARLTYRIVSGNADGKFAINENTGRAINNAIMMFPGKAAIRGRNLIKQESESADIVLLPACIAARLFANRLKMSVRFGGTVRGPCLAASGAFL